MSGETVLKALVLAGCGSRRAMAEAVKAGRVTLNGQPVESFTQTVLDADVLKLDGKAVGPHREEFVYLMLNKPLGVLSTTRDERGRRTVMDLVPPEYHARPLHLVGRLDMDSSGLVILTDDGKLTQAQADALLSKITEHVTAIVNGERPAPLFGRGPRHDGDGIRGRTYADASPLFGLRVIAV